MSVKTVGYIGLGKAGWPLAANLPRAGYNLIVRDVDPERERQFAEENENVVVAGHDAGAFKEAEVLVTMLPQGKVVREVLLGSNGIAKGLKPGTIIVDTSSSSPYDTKSLGEELKALDLVLIDSPVTQKKLGDTATGDVTFMVGCDSQDALDKALPVLQAMAKYIFHMGALGSGHAMKTLNNYISAASIIALNDALVTGQQFGLNPVQMIDVLNVGTGVNFSTLYSYKSDALPRKYSTGYQLGLLVKDMGISQELFEKVGFETKLPKLILEYLKDAASPLEPDADHTECLKGWERRAGIELKSGTPDGSSVTAVKGK